MMRFHLGGLRSRHAWIAITVVGGGLALPLLGASSRSAGPAVSGEVLSAALASRIPERPTMADEIAHFEARQAARDGEPFSRLRLIRAHALAFRAYGDASHLDAADEHLAALLEDGPPLGVESATESSLRLTRHDFTGALAAAEAEASSAPSESTPLRLFDALWATGRIEEARAVLERPLDTMAVSYLSRRARILDADGEVRAARDLFRQVVAGVDAYAEPVPVRAWARVELGNFELHSGDPQAAVGSYLAALELLPGSPAALEGLASVAYGADRDLETARALYERALEHGAHLDLMPVLATVLEALGNREAADSVRGAFIDRATRSPETLRLYRRPLALLLAEDPASRARAVGLAREDLAARRDAGAWDTLAWTLFRAGRVREAALHLDRALSLGSPSPPVAWRAGIVLRASGERNRSTGLLRQALDGAVELSPQQVEEAERLLGA